MAYIPLGVAMAFSGVAQAALVCAPGDVLGPGRSGEVMRLGPLATMEFSNEALTSDRWQSNARPGLGLLQTKGAFYESASPTVT